MTTSADTPEDVAEDIEELLTWIDEGEFGGSTAGGGGGHRVGAGKLAVPLWGFSAFSRSDGQHRHPGRHRRHG